MRCRRPALLSKHESACVLIAARMPALLHCCSAVLLIGEEQGHGQVTQAHRETVSACMNLDSDTGFELPGCDLPPLGRSSYETASLLQRITRSSFSRPSLHHS